MGHILDIVKSAAINMGVQMSVYFDYILGSRRVNLYVKSVNIVFAMAIWTLVLLLFIQYYVGLFDNSHYDLHQ